MFRPLPVGFSTIAYAFSTLPQRILSPVFLHSGPDDPRAGPVREDRVPPFAEKSGQDLPPLPVHDQPFRSSAEMYSAKPDPLQSLARRWASDRVRSAFSRFLNRSRPVSSVR